MSSSVSFNETLSGSQIELGIYSDIFNTQFTPTIPELPFHTIQIDGSINNVGDQVNITVTDFGMFQTNGTATYDGYYEAGGQRVYVFSPENGCCGSLSCAFAITGNGQSVPFAFGCQTLNTGAADPCFLRGSMIATPRGEIAVEQLAVGDAVTVMVNGQAVSRPVRWIGSNTASLAADADIDQFPVRIRAGAFAEQVPHRDLLVTSEHCVFVDGVLIPARMLVNHRSIVVDRSITTFEFFHVELEQHGILVSEGLETESYLDTGNRVRFGVPADAAQPAPKSWATDAAAPLTVDRAVVEPIWQRLAERAAALGLVETAPAAAATTPALRLVTDTGMEIEPSLVEGRSYAFVVPGGVEAVRLRSHTARPSETVGRFVDDRRELGVLVGQVSISEGRRRQSYDTHLTANRLSGWHGLEAGAGARWTNGNASLRLDTARTGNRPVFLDIEVLATGVAA